MTTEFSPLGLIPQLEQTVSDLGYITPTPIQLQIIPLMLDGKDVIGQATEQAPEKRPLSCCQFCKTLERISTVYKRWC